MNTQHLNMSFAGALLRILLGGAALTQTSPATGARA
jgi:hypothetical protein